MWITGDVELPDEILHAHERGDLVFFVGAGASVDMPSDLPLFDGLARELAQLAVHPFSEDGGLDFFIGQLESLPQGFDAHLQAQRIILNQESRFNPLHRTIIDLAGNAGAFRVVTTNYDNHLTSAAAEMSVRIPDTWYAPALPLGNDFSGLVHIHGSALRAKEELILTDRDFGRAYLTDAWATRFLLPMFDRFTVVFIGYSHDDPIMRYLALGLPSKSESATNNRFAFTNDPSNKKWDYLGIQPISYPVSEGSHQALTDALSAWAHRSRMGRNEHQLHTQEIVAGGAPLALQDGDYLRSRLRIEEGALDFWNATQPLDDQVKLEWLKWLETLPEFKSLFSPSTAPTAHQILGEWFTSNFINSPTLNGAALQTLQRQGQSMSRSLLQKAALAASKLVKHDRTSGKRWQAILVTSIHGQSAPTIPDLLLPLESDERPCSRTLVRAILRPFLVLNSRWYIDDSDCSTLHPDAKASWIVREPVLTEQVLFAVQTSAPQDRSLSHMLEDALLSAYELLDAYYGERHWDPLGSHRSAIEPHSQDQFREPVDSIVDGLRDYGTKALSLFPDLPDRWWGFDRPLFKRLALHLIANDPDRSGDEKILWLLEHAGIYELGLKHESYQLLAAGIPHASSLAKAQLLEEASVGPKLPEDFPNFARNTAYSKYNLLVWLTRIDPDWTQALEALDSIQNENPDFRARDHPDFDTWMTSGVWGGISPMNIEDFMNALTCNATGALEDLLSGDYSEQHFDQPTWSDALSLVEQTAEEDPHLGLRLWSAVVDHHGSESKRVDLLRAITEGWGKAALGDAGLPAIERITALIHEIDSAYSIGQFMLNQIRSQINASESSMLASMRDLARVLWNEHGAKFSHPDGLDVLSLAPLYLNSWPGFLAQYWTLEIQRRWKHAHDEWSGFTEQESSALIDLLSGNEYALDATLPALARQLSFFFAADPDFTLVNILPLFKDPHRHAFGWTPFLNHPRYNDRLLTAGLLESAIEEFDRLHELPDEQSTRKFLEFVCSVVSRAGITQKDRKRLLDQTILASNGEYAVDFTRAVLHLLREEGVDGAEVWREWLGEHVESRLDGIPRNALHQELAKWADCVPFVGEFIPDATALFAGRDLPLGKDSIIQNIPSNALTAYGPELVDFFVQRIRITDSRDDFTIHGVRELIRTVRGTLGDNAAQQLVRAAMDSGILTRNEA